MKRLLPSFLSVSKERKDQPTDSCRRESHGKKKSSRCTLCWVISLASASLLLYRAGHSAIRNICDPKPSYLFDARSYMSSQAENPSKQTHPKVPMFSRRGTFNGF